MCVNVCFHVWCVSVRGRGCVCVAKCKKKCNPPRKKKIAEWKGNGLFLSTFLMVCKVIIFSLLFLQEWISGQIKWPFCSWVRSTKSNKTNWMNWCVKFLVFFYINHSSLTSILGFNCVFLFSPHQLMLVSQIWQKGVPGEKNKTGFIILIQECWQQLMAVGGDNIWTNWLVSLCFYA